VKNLTDVLMNELKVSPDKSLQGGPRAARRAVLLLIKLGKSTQACDLFLKHRTAVLRQSIKQLKIEGSTNLSITRLCNVFFSHLRETGKEFLKAFPNHKSCSSSFVVWAHTELSRFSTNFSRQVFTPQVALSTIAECIILARTHCEKLTEIGLDLTFSLLTLLQPDLHRAVQEAREKLIEAIKLRAAEDKWRPINTQSQAGLRKFVADMLELGLDVSGYVYDECWISVTTPTIQFSRTYLSYVEDSIKLIDTETHNLIVEGWCDVLRAQCRHIHDSFANEKLRTESKLIQKNAVFVLEVVLPIVDQKYKEKFGNSCYQLEEMKRTLNSVSQGAITKYSRSGYI
jgi:hypothetical protein